MNNINSLFMLTILLGVMHTSPLKAQDAEEVIRAAKGAVEALNNKDAEAYMNYLDPGFTRFLPQNPGLLKHNDVQSMKDNFDDGMKFNMQLEDLDAAMYGNIAVVNGFETGPARFPDGSIMDGKRKYSSVWAYEKGQWKMVHLHISLVGE